MSEPKRWMDEAPPEPVEQLLRAAAADRPTEQSLARTLSVLGIGASAAGAAGTAGAATVGAAASAGAGIKASGVALATVVVKWGAVVTVVGAAGVLGKVALTHVNESNSRAHAAPVAVSPAHAREPRVARAPERPSAAAPAESGRDDVNDRAPAPFVLEPAPAAPATSRSVAGGSLPNAARNVTKSPPAGEALPEPERTAAAVESDRLAEEVRLVDRARGALARGDAAGTLAALDEYDARFSQRKFAPEALYLRMEALVRLGRTSAARNIANTLASAYPKSPHAARARQVLGEAIP